MLKWIDLVELMGYVTALFSVSVSYASKVQKEHYSDFLGQNQRLRESLFSPFFAKVIMVLLGLYLIRFVMRLFYNRKHLKKEKKFSVVYIVFLGCMVELLLLNLYQLTFVGAPMLISGVLLVFFVEIRKLEEENKL